MIRFALIDTAIHGIDLRTQQFFHLAVAVFLPALAEHAAELTYDRKNAVN